MYQGLVQAQTGSNSPYSRFGLGDLIDQNFVALRSMGGISTAFSDQFYTNLSNPASLGALQATAFEIGFDATRANLKSATESETYWGWQYDLLFPCFSFGQSCQQIIRSEEQRF